MMRQLLLFFSCVLSLFLKNIVWFRSLDNPIKIYEDNSGAIILAKHGKFAKNSKHIDVSYHFVDDLYRKGVITVVKINTEKQIADLLTKSLGRTKFEMLRTLKTYYTTLKNS